MPRAVRSPFAVPATLAAIAALLPGGDLQVVNPTAALWVDGASPACSDAQARVLDPAHPYCSVARAASQVVAGDTVHIAPGQYLGAVRPGVVLDGAGAANTIRLIATSDVRFEGLEVTGGLNQGVWVEASDRVVL